MILIVVASANSVLVFSEKPTLSELKKAYKGEFLWAWGLASKRLDKVINPKPVDKYPSTETNKLERMKFDLEKKYPGITPIHLRYVNALKKIDELGDSPDGVTFYLNSPTGKERCRLLKRGNKYILHTKNMDIKYESIAHVIRNINGGYLNRQITRNFMLTKACYSKYSKRIGSLELLEKGTTAGGVYMELEWEDSEPAIRVEVLRHGAIKYTVTNENVGPYGGKFRTGYANNFSQYMMKLEQLRKWADGKKHKRGENLASQKEIANDAITNPYSFTSRSKLIGRPFWFHVQKNGVVKMNLDWGGGNNKKSKSNMKLNVWVLRDGRYRMILSGRDLVGKKAISENHDNFNSMIKRIAAIKKYKLGVDRGI